MWRRERGLYRGEGRGGFMGLEIFLGKLGDFPGK